MLLTKSLKDAEFVLYDINKKTADLNKIFLDKLSGQLNIQSNIVSTDNKAFALKGANYVLITISTGGLEAMAYDLSIPEEYGIYHTVGDTQGPGGWARSIRNFNAFVDYAGLNHFFWITEAKIGKKDIIQDLRKGLRKKLKNRTITDLLKIDHKDPMGFKSGRYVADELFRMRTKKDYWKLVIGELGDVIDIVVETDDYSTQDSQIISEDVYYEVIEPRLHDLVGYIKALLVKKNILVKKVIFFCIFVEI